MQRWFEAIQRRNVLRWLVAYAAAGWGITEATGFAVDNFGAPERLLNVVLFLLLVLFFVVLVLVWYHGERGAQRPTRVEGLLLSGLLIVAAGGSVWIARAPGPEAEPGPADEIAVVDLGERSLAVLPFRSTVEDPELAWLDSGVAELLSTSLAQIDDLRVVSEQRIRDLLGQLGAEPGEEPPDRVTSRLVRLSGARLTVTGSVFGRADDLTIAATLADATTGEIRASATARGGDVFTLVDEVAAGLRDGIGAGGEQGDLVSTARLTTGDLEAFRAYEAGRRAFQRYLYAESAEHFGRALALDSTFALARFRRALALYQLGAVFEAEAEASRAQRDLGQASERDRLFIQAFDQFGEDTAAAVATVRELVRKYPDEKEARIIFAGVLAGLRGDEDPEARALLTETLRLDPSYAPAYNLLAYSHAASGNLEVADSLILRYVELWPDEPNAWDSRGEILEIAGRMEEAREAYRHALELRPDFRFSIDHLARTYLVEDDAPGARRALAPHLGSDLPEVRVRAGALAGDAHVWEGAVDEGIAAYESAEREAAAAGLSGLRAWRLRDLVQLRLALGDHAGALEAADSIRRLEPGDMWWVTARFDSLVAAGDLAGLERWKTRVEAEVAGDSSTEERLPLLSRLMDVWVAYLREDHPRVLSLAADLPESMGPGVITQWPVYRSMLTLGQTEALLSALRDYREPNLFDRGPRFQPLRVRWAQYFEARAHEARGDTVAAVSGYEALVRGMGDGLARFPTLSDVPARLEALRAPTIP